MMADGGGPPGGLAPPLYLHSSVQGSIQGRLREGSTESEWEQRVVSIFRSQVPLLMFHPAQPLPRPGECHGGIMKCRGVRATGG